MVALDTLVVSTALSTIRTDLGASVAELEWTVNAYNLSLAVLLMTAAGLGDRYGRRRVFVMGIALFTLASAACALAPSIGALIAARAIQGIGAAMVLTLGMALVSAAFPPERRGVGAGDLLRGHRPGRGQRAAGGRRGHRGDRVGVDLLAERAARAGADPVRAGAHPARASGPDAALDLPGPRRS